MKFKLLMHALMLLAGANRCVADHFSIDLGTANTSAWTVSAGGISNAPPFVYDNGLTVTTTGDRNGYFLLGESSSIFDGFWTAKIEFYLPPAAGNIVLNYSKLGYDDAGILFLNGNPIGAAATSVSSTNPTPGQFVFVDGGPSQPWSFTGPDSSVSGMVTNGFLPGRTNSLSAIANNTSGGADGLVHNMVGGDSTSFGVEATVSYDLAPIEGSIAVVLFPGLQFSGTTGADYQIQYRTNLTEGTWNSLANIVLPESPFVYFDTDPLTNYASKYYRVSSSAEQVSLNIGTTDPSAWTVSATGITNAPPFVYFSAYVAHVNGLGVTSTGNGNGSYLLGTNLSAFDGFWTANTAFYLPPAASNIMLNYTNLGVDDAGVLFLNGFAIAATATTASSTNAFIGQFVFADGIPAKPRSFSGPNGLASGTVTNGFISGTTNSFSATINNTGNGPSGALRGLSGGDSASFTVAASVSYDLNPEAGSLAIALDPGLEISGTIGGIYQLQYTTNPTTGNWETLTNLVLPGSPYLFFDREAITDHLSRTYRVVAQ